MQWPRTPLFMNTKKKNTAAANNLNENAKLKKSNQLNE